MRVFHIVLIAIATVQLNAIQGIAGKVSTFTFTERSRLLTAEQSDSTDKRFLRKRQPENEENSVDEEAEERAQWIDALKKLRSDATKRAKLEVWFQKGKNPTFVRQQFKIPEAGEAMTSHKNYKYLQIFIKKYNGWKYHRFSGQRD
ncbi:hypothetical protein F444_22851 [Phytophthora nicotianae P1976]|uniref:RxLR effector protein n=1 Tax=Phytophthora nicotianae P1976 TaxID=1317066 RepID=A0A080YWK7_PHYNI|nr:hypothetical protein F444_22851 [Phytophthora nicotianae P1976]